MAKTALGKTVEGMINANSPKPEDGWTLGWDVVVSYSEEEINKTLARTWEKHRDEMVREIEAETDLSGNDDDDDDDDDDDTPKQKFKLELGAPRIKFVSDTAAPTVNLLLPVRKGNAKKSYEKKPFEIPENTYQIALKNIPIATVKGDYNEVQSKSRVGKLPDPIKGDKECRFENKIPHQDGDDFEVSWVVLDFSLKAGDLDVKGQMAPGHENDLEEASDLKIKKRIARGRKKVNDAAQVFFAGTAETDFQSIFDVIRHALATIKNKKLPKQAGVSRDLTPKKFRMAAFQRDGVKPILSLFIHVVDGVDEGETKNLQGKWQGIWLNAKADELAPIPSTHTASILIHPSLIYKDVLSQSLAKETNEGWEFKQDRVPEGGGILVQATLKEPLNVARLYRNWHSDNDQESVNISVNDWSKNMKGIPAKIHLRQRNMDEPPVMSIQWKFDTETHRTYYWAVRDTPSSPFATKQRAVSNWYTSFNLDHDVPLKINPTDYDVTLEVNTNKLANSWEVSEVAAPTTIWDDIQNIVGLSWLRGEETSVDFGADLRDQMRSQIPQFTLGGMGFGFFLTTNLLNPGAKVIQIDKEAGVRVPGNLFLVGKVVQGQDDVKSGKV